MSNKGTEKIKELIGDYDHEKSKSEILTLPELEKREGEESMTPAVLRQQ